MFHLSQNARCQAIIDKDVEINILKQKLVDKVTEIRLTFNVLFNILKKIVHCLACSDAHGKLGDHEKKRKRFLSAFPTSQVSNIFYLSLDIPVLYAIDKT